MIQRKTQSPTYWGDGFRITAEDLQYLSTVLVEDELPRSAEELGRMLVTFHCQQEQNLIERAISKGTMYQPKLSFDEGESVVFSALGYRVGQVVGIRPGHNPEYDAFQVIQVEFENGKTKEFAAQLTSDHPLNHEPRVAEVSDGDLKSPEELADEFGGLVGEKLVLRLESEPDFIRLAGKWFPGDLLVEVHIGHLNLAEAVLDMADGGPLPTEDLLGDLELPEEITPQLRVFSLNYALQEDDRFDEVGPAGEVQWFLRRLEPEPVQSPPVYLEYQELPYNSALLTSEMLALERQLDDEWSDLEPPDEVSEPVTVVLTYPHWKAGTLPLSSQLSQVFPTGRTHRIRFAFVDGDTDEEIPGWVVREGRYVYGLEEWYQENDILVGTYLELKRGDRPGVVIIRPSNRRPRREWVRIALPVNGRLTFEMRKQLIACDYDELMVIAEEDRAAVDEIWANVRQRGMSLSDLVADVFPELAKLSPQGTVHAATLYSAVNVAIRTPPGPLLAELVFNGAYAPVGDNYWVLRTNPDTL